MARKTRILLHYTHKQTLGHTTRTISLVTGIIARYGRSVALTILQGGMPQPYITHPGRARVLDIPFPFDTRASFRTRSHAQQSEERAQFIIKTATNFAPDIFLTEFFPFGRMDYMPELLPAIRHLRKTGCRIMASIGYPYIIDLARLKDQKFAAVHKAILALYDTLLIHTPQGVETPHFRDAMKSDDLAQLYEQTLRTLDKKIVYTGYICPERVLKPAETTTSANMPPAKNTIVVSRGGGAVYPKLIINAIQAHKILGKNFRTIICCGPSTSDHEMSLFQNHIRKHGNDRLQLVSHLPNLDDLLRTCQASVSLSGYNTAVQLMQHGTPAVIVPYQNTPSQAPTNDQLARARLLQDRLGATILSYDTMTPQTLAKAIRNKCAQPRPKPAPSSWFTGADTAARLIMQEI